MSSPAASMILRGGHVLTLDARSRVASAVAVRDQRIVAIGTDAEIAAHAGPATRFVDLAGRSLMPGLTDGHAHVDREGLKGLLPSLAGLRSIRELIERLREIAARTPAGTWIVTMPLGEPPEHRYTDTMFEEGRLPSREDLDQVSRTHPILIRCAWGYWSGQLPLVSIANSAALDAAGIANGTASPSPLVTIECDARGTPTGRVFEQAHQPIAEFTLFRRAPHFTADDRVRTLAASMRAYNAAGTTAVFEGHGVAPEVMNAYRRAHEQDQLTLRAQLVVSPGWSGASALDAAQWVADNAPRLLGRGEGDAWLRLGGAYAEPDKEPHEARLRARCAPQTGWAGFCYDSTLAPDALTAFLAAAARERLRVCGIQMGMLPLYEAAARVAPIDDLAWVIAHPITLDDEQIARVRDRGLHITTHTNGHIGKRGVELLASVGPERAGEIVPIRSMLEAGINVALGTDNIPVSLWHCIGHATDRIERKTGAVIGAAQRITREQALRCATVNGARLCMDANDRGTLEPGKLADMIVLPDNPLNIDSTRLPNMTPDLTIVGGRIVFER